MDRSFWLDAAMVGLLGAAVLMRYPFTRQPWFHVVVVVLFLRIVWRELCVHMSETTTMTTGDADVGGAADDPPAEEAAAVPEVVFESPANLSDALFRTSSSYGQRRIVGAGSSPHDFFGDIVPDDEDAVRTRRGRPPLVVSRGYGFAPDAA